MNGAIAELLARISNAPTRTRVIMIGASQYFLLVLMNSQSSLTTCIFDIANSLIHLFVMSRIPLPVRIRMPVGTPRACTTPQRIPTHCSFYQSDRRKNAEKNDSQNHSSRNKRETLGQLHPGTVRPDECSWIGQAQ